MLDHFSSAPTLLIFVSIISCFKETNEVKHHILARENIPLPFHICRSMIYLFSLLFYPCLHSALSDSSFDAFLKHNSA